MPINPLTYNVQFIGEEELKTESIINDNVDMKLLDPLIAVVQDTKLLRMLGSGLFVDLQNKIAQAMSGQTQALNDNEQFLMNAYIKPLMIWGVMTEAPLGISFKFMNKGVEKMSSDNSTPAPTGDLDKLKDWASDKFDWYAQRLVYFLNANQNLFPAYNQTQTMDDVAPTVRGYKSKLYIGNGREGTGVCDPNFYYR